MKTISLLHPFSAQAIGLNESDLYYYHSKPHEKALRVLQKEGYKISIDYFTGKSLPYKKNISGVTKNFWAVTKPMFVKRHVWRKQHSIFHYVHNLVVPPELTIINMSGHGSAYVFKLAKLLNKKNKPYVAMIGGLNVSYTNNALQYYHNAHHVIVHTQVQKNSLKKQDGFKNITIEVMPLGVDTALFKPKLNTYNNMQLLYVGRISRLKQIEKTIESLNYIVNVKMENVQLHIIGPSSDLSYLNELKLLVSKFDLDNHVTFVGSLKQEELIPYYQNASLLLLPSKHESFGMVMVEAMACGTPVIALKGAGGPDEIIENGLNGFLCEASGFNQKVYKVISSKTLLLELSTNSRKLAERKWSLEHTTNCFRKTINNVFSTT